MKNRSCPSRSLVKAFSWETFSFFLTMLITWGFLGNLTTSFRLTSLLFVIKIILFFAHERLWHRVEWGKTVSKE